MIFTFAYLIYGYFLTPPQVTGVPPEIPTRKEVRITTTRSSALVLVIFILVYSFILVVYRFIRKQISKQITKRKDKKAKSGDKPEAKPGKR